MTPQAPQQPPKNIFKSKTFWISIIGIILDILQNGGSPGPPSAAFGINIVNRLFTTQPSKVL